MSIVNDPINYFCFSYGLLWTRWADDLEPEDAKL
jgi:hypothetical protein